MKPARLHRDAEGDLYRAALRASATIAAAVTSLRRLPERGTPRSNGMRELIVPFGSGAYIIRYVVEPDAVLVLRIFHALEDR